MIFISANYFAIFTEMVAIYIIFYFQRSESNIYSCQFFNFYPWSDQHMKIYSLMNPFQNEWKSLVDKKQQEDTLRGCMWRTEMLHKLKLHHHHDKIKGLWCIVKLTDEFNFSELLSLTIKILMRFVFFGFI